MAKLLLRDCVEYFQKNGDLAITKNMLYAACRAGKLRHARAGNRYILDTNVVDQWLLDEMELSVSKDSNTKYGHLREVE